MIRLDLRETLEEEGYEVVGETSRGDEIVSLVRAQRPDLAILDINLPGGDGLTAAAEITAERLAAVLILTAFSQRELVDPPGRPVRWLTSSSRSSATTWSRPWNSPWAASRR